MSPEPFIFVKTFVYNSTGNGMQSDARNGLGSVPNNWNPFQGK